MKAKPITSYHLIWLKVQNTNMNGKGENLFLKIYLNFTIILKRSQKSHFACACFSEIAWDYPKLFSFDIWGPHPLNDWLLHIDINKEAFKKQFYLLQTLFDWVETVWINKDKHNVNKVPLPHQEEYQHKSCQQQASSYFCISKTNESAKGHELGQLTAMPTNCRKGNLNPNTPWNGTHRWD